MIRLVVAVCLLMACAQLPALVIVPECPEYDRDSYYPSWLSKKLEPKIWERDKATSWYTGQVFEDEKQSDVDHLVPLREAHDSGMCGRSDDERRAFGEDLDNLALATPGLNRYRKRAKDVAEWLPPWNACYYVHQWVKIKKKYNMTADAKEWKAIAKVLTGCKSFALRLPRDSSG